MNLIGLLGGTFNPIHYGHLRMAQELGDAIELSEVRFIPSANPPHKTRPEVSAQDRAAMVKLAIENNPLFKLDTRELERSGASYTIDTLTSLRDELGSSVALCLFMGSDAFTKLDTWHRWTALLDYCHIILVERPSTAKNKLPEALNTLLHDCYTENVKDLSNKNSGYIHMQKVTALDISSTALRQHLKSMQSVRYLLPDAVLQYIQQHKLYQ